MVPDKGHQTSDPHLEPQRLEASLSSEAHTDQIESTQVGQDGAAFAREILLTTSPTTHQRTLASLREELETTRHQVAELESLLADLPTIFERKFLQRLQPLEYKRRLLVDENHSLRENIHQDKSPAAEKPLELASALETSHPSVEIQEAATQDVSFQRPLSEITGQLINRISNRLARICQKFGLIRGVSPSFNDFELANLNEQVALATCERVNAEARLLDCQQQLNSLKAVFQVLPELLEQRFQKRVHNLLSQQQLLVEENTLLRRLLKDDLEAALKIISQHISEGNINPNQLLSTSLWEKASTVSVAKE